MSGTLPYRFLAAFSLHEHPDSPLVDPSAPGVALAVTDIVLHETSVQFMARVAFGFSDDFYSAFKFIHHAIVITLEEPDTARVAAVRAIDPERSYLRQMWPNYGGPLASEPSIVFAGGWVNIPLQVAAIPRAGHGGLYVAASLQRHRSARIRVALDPPAAAGTQPQEWD